MHTPRPALPVAAVLLAIGAAGCLSPSLSGEPLRPGDRVRPVPAPGPASEYEVGAVQAGILDVHPPSGGEPMVRVRLGALESLEVERETSAGAWVWRGALQGALIGAALGASTGIGSEYGADWAIGVGAAGGLVGGLLGAMVGGIRGARHAGPRWVPVPLDRIDPGPAPGAPQSGGPGPP
jgi:hypothetical protein